MDKKLGETINLCVEKMNSKRQVMGKLAWSRGTNLTCTWYLTSLETQLRQTAKVKLSKFFLYIHSYTHLITSSALNECLLVHNSQNNCSTECLWLHVTQKSIEVWLRNKCHKIYLRGPFGIFCLYVILTIWYLKAQTIETSSLPTDSSRPLFKQIEIFSGILYVSTVSTFLNIRASY